MVVRRVGTRRHHLLTAILRPVRGRHVVVSAYGSSKDQWPWAVSTQYGIKEAPARVGLPKGDYSSTAVYEILPNGTAEKRFDVQAWMFHMFRVR